MPPARAQFRAKPEIAKKEKWATWQPAGCQVAQRQGIAPRRDARAPRSRPGRAERLHSSSRAGLSDEGRVAARVAQAKSQGPEELSERTSARSISRGLKSAESARAS